MEFVARGSGQTRVERDRFDLFEGALELGGVVKQQPAGDVGVCLVDDVEIWITAQGDALEDCE